MFWSFLCFDKFHFSVLLSKVLELRRRQTRAQPCGSVSILLRIYYKHLDIPSFKPFLFFSVNFIFLFTTNILTFQVSNHFYFFSVNLIFLFTTNWLQTSWHSKFQTFFFNLNLIFLFATNLLHTSWHSKFQTFFIFFNFKLIFCSL